MSEMALFFQLEQELKQYKKMMIDASDIILNTEVSKYPIFIVHQQEVEIGIPIADKDKVVGNWSINASTLEELVAKQLVNENKVEDFCKNFKSTESFICLFVLSELGAQFIYLPR